MIGGNRFESEMEAAIAAIADLPDLMPHEISATEMSLEMAFQEIDLLKRQINVLNSFMSDLTGVMIHGR